MLLQCSSVRLIAVKTVQYLRLVTHFPVPQKRVNRIRELVAGKIIVYKYQMGNYLLKYIDVQYFEDYKHLVRCTYHHIRDIVIF